MEQAVLTLTVDGIASSTLTDFANRPIMGGDEIFLIAASERLSESGIPRRIRMKMAKDLEKVQVAFVVMGTEKFNAIRRES